MSPKQYKPVSLKKYIGEFCCQGNKGHLRSKIAKFENDLLTSLMPVFVICIKFDDEVIKKNSIPRSSGWDMGKNVKTGS